MARPCVQEKNLKNCPCTYHPCARKGLCCECISHHKAHGEVPGCLFPPEAERSYDRSLGAFLRAHGK